MSDPSSSPEHGGANNPASDFINASGNYPTGAVAAAQIRAAAVAAAAAAAVSNSGSLSSVSSSLGNSLTSSSTSGLPSLSQAASLASTYPGSMMSGMGYSERSYESQMASHCQSNSYSSYQPPPSPYRPHPVSPPAHHAHHQTPYSTTHGSGQMHPPSVPYVPGHQLGPYTPSQAHYSSSMNNQDVYSGRSPVYGGNPSAHLIQQGLKPQPSPNSNSPSPWSHSGHDAVGSSSDMLQVYAASSAASRQPPSSSLHLTSATPPSPMPPPPLRSPPVSMSTSANHFHRQMTITSSPNNSPHAWQQANQISSPGGVLHSPRATPSPLPNHGRSPGHAPFSPPPPSSTPSPHHHQSSVSGISSSPISHHQQCAPKTPPSSASPTTSLESPSQTGNMVGGPSDPLQSLQKMVMLDSELVSPEASAAVVRGHYEIHAAHHSQAMSSHVTSHQQNESHHHQQQSSAPPPAAPRPLSYFSSVETLAGNDPGSPYPTYYNLDQNRLCTPPRATGSTPTSSTFTSAQDSASNSSVSVESYPNVPEAGHSTNGELVQHTQNASSVDGSRVPGMESGDSSLIDCNLQNGSSGEMLNHYDMPCFMGKKKISKGRGRQRSSSDDFNMPSPIDVGKVEHQSYNSIGIRKGYPIVDGVNGQLEYCQEEKPPAKKRGRGNRYIGPPRWAGRMIVGENEELGGAAPSTEEVSGVCSLDEGGVYLSLALKRGQRKKRSVSCPSVQPGGPEIMMDDPRYTELAGSVARSPRGRGMRSPRGTGRRARRRMAGNISHFVNDRPHFDGGFLEVSGNATDGLTETGFLGPDHSGHDQSLLSRRIEEESVPENSSIFLKSGMLEVPRSSAQHDLHFTPRNSHLCSPNGVSQECINNGARTNDVYAYHQDPSTGMDGSGGAFHNQVPMERKRGRPRGSKNKPKLPGDEKKSPSSGGKPPAPATTKQSEENADIVSSNYKLKSKSKFAQGPVVRVTGSLEKPLSVEVVNFTPADDVKELNKSNKQQAKKLTLPSLGTPSSSCSSVRKRLGVIGHTSTLSPQYDAFTRDRSWICSLCHSGSHYRGLGDLYGPYFLSDDQQKELSMTHSGHYSSGVPTPSSIPDVEDNIRAWDAGSSVSPSPTLPASSVQSSSYSSALVARQARGKRKRSETSEDCLKTTLLKKAKQGKKSSTILGAGPPAVPAFVESSEMDIAPGGAVPIRDIPAATLPQMGEYWVHEDCAVWSQGVYLLRQQVRGLDDAVKLAADMICCKCKLNGAMLGCLNKGCTEQYHFLCAKDRGCEMDEENFSMLCSKHKRKCRVDTKPEDCSASISSTTSSAMAIQPMTTDSC